MRRRRIARPAFRSRQAENTLDRAVEEDLISQDNVRDFTFANAAELARTPGQVTTK